MVKMKKDALNINDLFNASIPYRSDDLIMFFDTKDKQYKKTHLSTIYENIYEQFLEISEVSSMAFETSSDYALSSHDHDIYNHVTFQNFYEGDWQVKIHESTKNKTWYINLPNGSSQYTNSLVTFYEPKIGEVRFDIGKIRNINITDSDFDGWVYANGQTYNADDFKNPDTLIRYFPSTDGNTNHFTIPQLSNFLKIDSTLKERGGIQHVNFTNAVKKHNHGLQLKDVKISTSEANSAKNETETYFITSENMGSGNTTQHAEGKDTERISTSTEHEYSGIRITNLRTHYFGEDRESHPSYNNMPVMVYVGQSKYSKL